MIKIRNMTRSDMERAMELKDSVGWNQVEWDWDTFLTLNPELCYVACDGEEVVATTTAISYGGEVAWIGMVIVEESHRGSGISTLLMKRAIHDLEGHRTIKLDATHEGLPVYDKLGFKVERSFIRMTTGHIQLQKSNAARILPAIDFFAEMASRDRKVLGYDRTDFLKCMLDTYGSISGVVADGGVISGYLLGRKGSNYTQLGPLIAMDTTCAEMLVEKLISAVGRKAMVVDVNSDKKGFIEWLQNLGFSRQREFVRMYLGKETKVEEKLQFLIAGPEFG